MERDFLASLSRGEWSSELRGQMIDPDLGLPLSRQCELLGIARSTYYYERGRSQSEENLELMRVIDEIYLAHPENGSAHDGAGLEASRHLRQWQTSATTDEAHGAQKSVTATQDDDGRTRAHPVYPYLLRDLVIDHPNHVWAADITYVPFKKGFWYLVRDHGLALEKGAQLAVVEHHDE